VEVYEFVVPGPPVSAQANDRVSGRRWQERVRFEAIAVAPARPPFVRPDVHLTLVHLCEDGRVDLDNVLKPVQDRLEKMFYPNDRLISDVDAHRRSFHDQIDVSGFSPVLRAAYGAGNECVYIRLEAGRRLEELL
jgi:hypothetical protein